MIGDIPPQPRHDDEPSLLTPTFAVVMVASFAYFAAMGASLPTVPRFIEGELNGGDAAVGLGVGVYALSAALLRPWVGRLGDTRGRRVLAVGGSVIVCVSFLAYTLATSMWILVLARLLTGVGEAAGFVGFATAAQDLAPDHRRGEAASYFSVALYGGLAVGPPIGEVLVDRGFTTVWTTLAGFAAVAAVASLWIPKGRTVAVAATRQFLQRDALGPGVLLFLGLIPFTAFAAFIPLYAEGLGLDSVGGVLALYAGLVLLIRIFGARLPDRLGWRRGSAIALTAVGAGISLVAVWASVSAIWLAAVTLAVGMSLMYPSLFTAVMSAAPEDERTHAVGTFSVFFDLAQGLGATFVGVVVSLASGNERAGFGAAGALAFSGLAFQWLLRNRIGRARTPVPAVADAADIAEPETAADAADIAEVEVEAGPAGGPDGARAGAARSAPETPDAGADPGAAHPR